MGNESSPNILQAIAIIEHPEAGQTWPKHLRAVWEHPKLWEDDPWLNWVAYMAEKCIKYPV
jgi:hypothetical protein